MEKQKEYVYFIIYYYETKKREQGWGTTYVTLSKEITNSDIVKKVSDFIKEEQNCAKIDITYYILMKEED